MGDVLLAMLSCLRAVYSLGFLGGLTCILGAWLGVMALLFCCTVGVDAFVLCVWTRFFPPKALWAKRGCWAIVTGGGRGIGRAFALELADRGLHVCIIGRSEGPLRATEKDVIAKGVKCHVVVHCFAPVKSMVTAAQELGEQLAAVLPLTTVLVNNVGTVGLESNFGASYLNVHHPKLEASEPLPSTARVLPRETLHSLAVTEEVIASNVCGMILMSSLVIPYMKRNAANVCEALVINIGSIAGLRGFKKFSTYAATKSFVNTFASGLEQEMQDENGGGLLEAETKGPRILVQTVTPAITATNLVPKGLVTSSLFRWLVVSPQDVAFGALRVAGVQSVTDGTLSHCIQNNALRVLSAHVPRSVMNVCCGWITRLAIDATRKSTPAKER